MSGYFVAPRAQRDLDEISRYTLDTWGEAQLRDYMAELEAAFDLVANRPSLGRSRSDIHPDYRYWRAGNHLIFFVQSADGPIEIIGVPHQSMDIDAYFDADDGD